VTVPARTRGPRRRSCTGCLLWALVVTTSVAVAIAAIVLVVRSSGRDQPPGPPDAFRTPSALPVAASPLPDGDLVFDTDRTGEFELYVQPAATPPAEAAPARRLTDDPRYDSWAPRLSPDRRTVVFHRTPAGAHDLDPAATSLWAAGSDGSGLVQLRPVGADGWAVQGPADWSPDGTQLVLSGGDRLDPQVHVTDALGRGPRRVTDRPGANLDPSFSPDGRWIVFAGCPQAECLEQNFELYRVPAAGGEATRLTADDRRDRNPAFSPDGTRLAWLTQVQGGTPGAWDVRVGGPEGQEPRRLVGDDGRAGPPRWARDGATIFLHRTEPGGRASNLYAVDPDGSNLRALTTGDTDAREYPAP
jgi:TolB protein